MMRMLRMMIIYDKLETPAVKMCFEKHQLLDIMCQKIKAFGLWNAVGCPDLCS